MMFDQVIHWPSSFVPSSYLIPYLTLHTTSKLIRSILFTIDVAHDQYIGWYDDERLGGYEQTVAKMLSEDPKFVLGHAIHLGLELVGALTTSRRNAKMADSIQQLNRLLKENERPGGRGVTQLERLHVEVVNHWSNGDMRAATRTLEIVNTLYPEDVYALKLNQDTYFYLGMAAAMRSSVGGAIGRINQSNPFKGYAHGLYSFGLEESNQYDLSQLEAKKALELIPNDTWAIHTYAHCLEMQAKTDEGLKWMLDTKSDWLPCSSLACHQYWHTALFYINKGQYDEAVGLLDNDILTRCLASSSGLDLHDAASMLYRMELVSLFSKTTQRAKSDDGKAGHSRWNGVYNICKEHSKDHINGFNDCHYLMAYLGMDDLDGANEIIRTLSETEAPALMERDSVVRPLMEAMVAFKLGQYSQVVDKMMPIRNDIVRIGGSHAQRDIFEQLLMVAAIKSDKTDHKKLVQRMAAERDLAHGRRTNQTELVMSN